MTGLRRYQDTLYGQLVSSGYSVQLVYPQQPSLQWLTKLGQYLGWDLATFFRSYPLRGSYPRADVYHIVNESLATLLVFNRLKPGVVTVHGLLPYLLRKKHGRNLYRNRIHRWFDAVSVRGLRRAQGIIAVSHFLKAELIRHAGVPGDRIHVIHEAVDHAIFRPQAVPAQFRQRHGLDNRYRYVLYVGSEQPEKNFLTLIRAFAILRERTAGVKLLKVGQPEYLSEREAALELVRQLGIEEDVLFMGHLGDELPLVYNASDLLAYPSRFEGFGFPPLEAMACGIPVVCSNAGALPEVAGDAALLIDPMDIDGLAEAMQELLCDEGLRKDYIARGLDNVQRFSWDVAMTKTIEAYQHAASRTW